MHFLSEKTKSMVQGKKSDQFDTTSDTCGSCDQWFSLWMLSCKFVLPLSAQSRKFLKMKRKLLMAPKKAKVNGNMDCFSLIKDQWKLFKGQWKVREFLTFWWVATLVMLRWPQFWLLWRTTPLNWRTTNSKLTVGQLTDLLKASCLF